MEIVSDRLCGDFVLTLWCFVFTLAHRLYGAFTLESILAAAFGRVINLQRGEADEVTKAAKGVFDSARGPLSLLFGIFILCKYKNCCFHFVP